MDYKGDLISCGMSKQTQTLQKPTQTSEDFFDVYKQNVEKYFENVVDSIPQHLQSCTNIQSEWYKACKNTISSVISLQQEFAKKAGIDTDISEAAKTAIVDTNKQIIKARSVQNQIIQATTSAIQENIKKWNDSTSAFTDLNRNILQSWISTFTQPRN
jgi:hypothetical protein